MNYFSTSYSETRTLNPFEISSLILLINFDSFLPPSLFSFLPFLPFFPFLPSFLDTFLLSFLLSFLPPSLSFVPFLPIFQYYLFSHFSDLPGCHRYNSRKMRHQFLSGDCFCEFRRQTSASATQTGQLLLRRRTKDYTRSHYENIHIRTMGQNKRETSDLK